MADVNFETWLNEKLKILGLDEDVYLEYLKGVLEEENDVEDSKESLSDILSGVLEEGVDEITEEILLKWRDSNEKPATENVDKIDIGNMKIRSIIEHQQTKVIQNGQKKHVDLELKKKMLQQYGAESDEEGDNEENGKKRSVPPANLNAQTVAEEERAKRDKAKKESDDKKQSDKINREKEKLKRDERSDKEKKRTQKGERRR